MDLSNKTIEELVAEKSEVVAKYDEAIDKLKAAKIAELRQTAMELGLTSADLFGGAGKAAKAKAAPKYAHPENPSLTWSGRGRYPEWVKDHIENGGDKDDFLIKKD